MFKPIQTNNTSSLQSIYIYTQKMNTLYILIRTSKNNLQTYSTKYNIIQCFNIINLHLYKKNWTPCIWIQSNLPNLNNQAFIACLINLHLCTKLVGHPVHGQRGEQSSKRKKATVTVEGDEKRGKGGVTKRSVTEVIRVVQVARTKGPFYYRVPLSSHARFENSSSVSRVAIIFSLVFPPSPPSSLSSRRESANLCRAALNGSRKEARGHRNNGVIPRVTTPRGLSSPLTFSLSSSNCARAIR